MVPAPVAVGMITNKFRPGRKIEALNKELVNGVTFKDRKQTSEFIVNADSGLRSVTVCSRVVETC